MRGEESGLSIGQLLCNHWFNECLRALVGPSQLGSVSYPRAVAERSPAACGPAFAGPNPAKSANHPFHSSVLSPFGLHRVGKFCLIGKSTPERWLNESQGNFLTYLQLTPPVLSKLGLRAGRVKFN